MKKRDMIIYRIITGLFSVWILFQVFAYFFMYEMTRDMFENLGVPTAIIYPLAVAKFLGLVAIWTNKSRLLKELAYLGFAVDFILAIATHIVANHGEWAAPFVALLMLAFSYAFNRKVYGLKEQALG